MKYFTLIVSFLQCVDLCAVTAGTHKFPGFNMTPLPHPTLEVSWSLYITFHKFPGFNMTPLPQLPYLGSQLVTGHNFS